MVSEDVGARQSLEDAARTVFLEAPVPIDLFVVSSTHLAMTREVAGAVKREDIRVV
jgi:hypothetical protein